ncbi:hypothetical protein LCGC14_0386040 [marine sediment metagenome]|uniref:HNH nuclease domain-containing protein n=1 Tax=marine sediment metagenome TaxID=412755 RepID=A0A0F9T0U3_9ZZZZ
MPRIGEIRRAKEVNCQGRGRYIWSACEICGKERWVHLTKGAPEFKHCVSCSRKLQFRVRSSHPSWKGGRFYSADGYVFIRLQADDPFFGMADSHNAVREHRLVMARHLNRCLLPWEIVHHLNGIRDDNRPENLEVLPTSGYHISDTILKSRVGRLEVLVEKQSQRIKLLEWHIREINTTKIKGGIR